MSEEQFTYAGSGVSIKAGDEAVQRIKPHVARTTRPEVIGGLGGFGGLFALDVAKFRQPVLVSTTDGVGTKALVAEMAGRYDTIGIDLVAMCVDDLVCCGAEPLFFLDYAAVGVQNPIITEQLVAGIAEGCVQAGCALVGGEMAEHPDSMKPSQFDLAGFAVGVVERDAMLDKSMVRIGDVLIGLKSPGLRSNGYSLARRVLLDHAGLTLDSPAWDGASTTLADELLRPSVIYAKRVLSAIALGGVHAVAHITGGGMESNLARVLPDNCHVQIDRSSWEVPRIFKEVQRLGNVADGEMARTFNMGIAMVLVVAAENSDAIKKLVDGVRIGCITA